MTDPEVTDVVAFCRGVAAHVTGLDPARSTQVTGTDPARSTQWENDLAARCDALLALDGPPTKRHPASLRLHALVAAGIAAVDAARSKEER